MMNNQLTNILKFATPISFGDIERNQKCDTETGVPIVPFYTTPSTIKIPKVCLTDLINLLEKTLSGIKKIDVKKKEHFIYEIEYFPIDDLKINPKTNKLYKKMYYTHLYAACKCFEKFPHNIICYTDNYYHRSPSIQHWFKAEIRLYYTKKDNHYLLEVNRLTGEALPFYDCFYNPIKAAFNEKNLLWMMRKNYVNLLDGIGPTEDHITHYALDELVCREICSYYEVPHVNHPLMIRR